MGLPSGVLWAPCNIDVSRPDGFAKSPYQYDCSFFSWGNVDAHNPTGQASFSPWSWGASNSVNPYVSSPGASINYPGSADLDHDAARVACGSHWRLPTSAEFIELIEYTDFINAVGEIIDDSVANKMIVLNDVVGIRLRSKLNGQIMFLTACGRGTIGTWERPSVWGCYWSSDLTDQVNGSGLFFSELLVNPTVANFNRYNGFAVRPVMSL